MAVLDTNVIIDLTGRSGRANQRAARDAIFIRVNNGEHLYISCFSLAELAVGIHRTRDQAAEREKISHAISRFSILEMTSDAIDRYGWLVAFRQRSGNTMETIDALIASTALAAFEDVLISRNARHFQGIPGLTVSSY